jgi:hypothetical protein
MFFQIEQKAPPQRRAEPIEKFCPCESMLFKDFPVFVLSGDLCVFCTKTWGPSFRLPIFKASKGVAAMAVATWKTGRYGRFSDWMDLLD